jgi:hypothetical protein
MAIREGIDPRDLNQAGWGVILTTDADPGIVEALRPLLELRQAQAGDRFRIFKGTEGYRLGDTKNAFLARYGVGPGPANPERMPYYLLLVGSFQQIPYRFQVQLDVQYAVGRLDFDTPDEYAAYAETVVAAEREPPCRQRHVVVFGVSNPDDPHTQISANGFAKPLVDSLMRRYRDGLQVESVIGSEASKARLVDLLHRDSSPELLITSGHGMVFPIDDPRATAHQGALLCADWPGPQAWQGPIPPEFYFSADDVSDTMQLCGMIALHYSSFSAGIVFQDDSSQAPSAISSRVATDSGISQVAKLAQRLLTQPRGGALAVVGLVDQAWSYASPMDSSLAQTRMVESILMRLLDGWPIGHALEYSNERYAELAVQLTDEMEEIRFGRQSDPWLLTQMWMDNNDARNFAVVGDPAVRLPADSAKTL